jgi:hypothetical protein
VSSPLATHNGDGDLSKCTAVAKKAKLDNLHYRNEKYMSFEKCMEVMTKCFNTLHKAQIRGTLRIDRKSKSVSS